MPEAEIDHIAELLVRFPPDDERDHAETEPGQPGCDDSWARRQEDWDA